MWNWLRRVFGEADSTPLASVGNERVLALERETQTLRLEMTERDQLIGRLKRDLERQRAGESQRVTAVADAGLERLISEAATPLTQLMTQAHLLEVLGKPVQAADILAVAKRLLRVFENDGVAWEGTVGATVPFDLDRHEPLAVDEDLAPGTPITIRFVGVRCRDQLLRRARVERAPS